MTLADLDVLLSAPKRLGIMAMLEAAKRVEFGFIQEQLGLTPSDLSKQMSALCEQGYATAKKDGRGPGSTTWFAITPAGRRAYGGHVEALRRLIDKPAAPTT